MDKKVFKVDKDIIFVRTVMVMNGDDPGTGIMSEIKEELPTPTSAIPVEFPISNNTRKGDNNG